MVLLDVSLLAHLFSQHLLWSVGGVLGYECGIPWGSSLLLGLYRWPSCLQSPRHKQPQPDPLEQSWVPEIGSWSFLLLALPI